MFVPVRIYRSLGVEGFGAARALVKKLGVRLEHVGKEVSLQHGGRRLVRRVLAEA